MPVDDRYLLVNMTQPEARRALERGTAILVTGSVEQHGGHLPLGTDAVAALTVAMRVAARLDAPVLPLSPIGVAPYHLPWPGSLTLAPDTMIGLLRDACAGLAEAGVRWVLVVNWHEGNTPTIRIAADLVQRSYRLRVIVAEAHVITNALFPEEMEFTHAGAMETAAVLAHDTGLVRLEQIEPGDPVEDGSRAHGLYRRRDVFPVLRDFREIAGTGWYGSPESVTGERAEAIMEAVADYVADQFAAVREQLIAMAPDGAEG